MHGATIGIYICVCVYIYLVYRDLLAEEYLCFDVLVVIKLDGCCLFSTV